MFRQIGRHVGAAVNFFGVLSLLSVHMYMYILKTERGNKRVREKSDILFWKETSYGDTKETGDTLRYLQKLSRRQGEAPGVNNHVILVVFMSARAVQSRKAAGFSIVCKVNSLNIALKASLNLGNQWEYRFNEIFNQIFPYCAGFRVFYCAALTELCGPAPAHPVRRPVYHICSYQVCRSS